MQRFHLEREQFLPVGLEDTFAFFADARNLEHLTPPWLRFQILSDVSMGVSQGSLIDYSLRLYGLPVRWQSEITLWQPPFAFEDVQRRGPYRHWGHTHSFEAVGAGTVVRDAVVYSVPGGWLTDRLLVRPELERIFDFRARALGHWALARLRRTLTAAGSRDIAEV